MYVLQQLGIGALEPGAQRGVAGWLHLQQQLSHDAGDPQTRHQRAPGVAVPCAGVDVAAPIHPRQLDQDVGLSAEGVVRVV